MARRHLGEGNRLSQMAARHLGESPFSEFFGSMPEFEIFHGISGYWQLGWVSRRLSGQVGGDREILNFRLLAVGLGKSTPVWASRRRQGNHEFQAIGSWAG